MSQQMKPEFTSTRIRRESSMLQSTRPGEEVNRIWPPPEHVAESVWTMDVPVSQSSSENPLLKPLISELGGLYEFRDGLVENFLEENPSLAGLLFQAHKVIREFFGSEVEMALEVVSDPEALGDQQLFVLIRTKLPRKEARAHLAELDRTWWLNALPASESKMEIALE